MKNYEIVAAKKAVATFEIAQDVFNMKFISSNDMARFVLSKHPELEGCEHDVSFMKKDVVVLTFYSVGDLVITEK